MNCYAQSVCAWFLRVLFCITCTGYIKLFRFCCIVLQYMAPYVLPSDWKLHIYKALSVNIVCLFWYLLLLLILVDMCCIQIVSGCWLILVGLSWLLTKSMPAWWLSVCSPIGSCYCWFKQPRRCLHRFLEWKMFAAVVSLLSSPSASC